MASYADIIFKKKQKKTSIPIPWPGYVQMTRIYNDEASVSALHGLKAIPGDELFHQSVMSQDFYGIFMLPKNTILGEILMEYPLVNTYHTTFGGMN